LIWLILPVRALKLPIKLIVILALLLWPGFVMAEHFNVPLSQPGEYAVAFLAGLLLFYLAYWPYTVTMLFVGAMWLFFKSGRSGKRQHPPGGKPAAKLPEYAQRLTAHCRVTRVLLESH
jgi:hypothetical protein